MTVNCRSGANADAGADVADRRRITLLTDVVDDKIIDKGDGIFNIGAGEWVGRHTALQHKHLFLTSVTKI
jgi:hypothetical protein